MAMIYGRPVNMTATAGTLALVLLAGAGGYLLWRWYAARRGAGAERVLGIEHSGRSARRSARVFEGSGSASEDYYAGQRGYDRPSSSNIAGTSY